MEKEIQQIRLFERVREQARWVFVESNLKEDLAQEAYLLAVEYAEKNNKPLSELSNTEIKFRCFEAARKLRLKEITSPEDAGIFETIPSEENIFENFARAEEEKISSQKISEVEWVLQNHPTLALTQTQWAIYNELKSVTSRTQNIWKAYYARQLGVTRQDIHNLAKVVRQKFEFANDFMKLLNGDILGFFNKYAETWEAPMVRRGIWGVIKPGAKSPYAVHAALRALYNDLQKTANSILLQHSRNNSSFNAKQLALSYHVLFAAVYADPPKAFPWLYQIESEIPKNSWLIKLFITLGSHYGILVDDYKTAEKYQEWLKYLLKYNSEESRWFSEYVVCYYGGGHEYTDEFLRSGGKLILPALTAEKVIKESYKNITGKFYPRYEILVDSNFLRLLLVLKHYPPKALGGGLANSLTTICQKSLHSKDLYVSKEAEKLLMKIKNGEITSV